MGTQELSVSWKDHSSVLVAVFEKLLSNKSLVDCTIAAEGQYLRVHKVVLSACSPYFEVLLNEDINKHPIIILKDVKFDDLKRIIDFVYKGEVKLPEDQLVEFLNVAESLQIKGLGAGSNESSGKRKIKEEFFSKKKSESPNLQKHSRRISDEVSEKSLPTENIVNIANADNTVTQWPDPNESANNSFLEESASVSANDFNKLEDTNLQNDFSISEGDLLNSSNQITLPAEPLIATSRTIVKVELKSENLEPKDNYVYQSIAEEFPETSYVVDTGNSPAQPSTSHQYCHLTSGHMSSSDMEEDSLARQEGMDQDCPEGFVSGAEEAILPDYTAQRHVGRREASMAGGTTSISHSSAAAAVRHRSRRSYDMNNLRSSRKTPQGGNTHSIRLYSCDKCQCNFNDPSNLKRHMRIHTGEKPFRCSVCNHSFRQYAHLKGHMPIHTGERLFCCDICGVTYRHVNSLSFHRRMHFKT